MKNWKLILSGVLVLALCGTAMACPNCKDTIATTDTAGTPGVAGAFNNSVYVMLGAFLGVLGLVTGIIVKAVRGG